MKNKETMIKKKIQYQESDYCGNYYIPSLVATLSDLATENAIEIGIWKEELAMQYGWILLKQTVQMKRPIHMGEEIYLSTRAGKSSKIQFTRQYDMLDENKEYIGGVYSIWALIDIQSRKLARPDKVGMEIPMIEEYPHYVEQYTKINQEIPVSFVMERKVMYSDLDINQHMTNHRYIEWALDVIDYIEFKDTFISELTMQYCQELAPNTKVNIHYGRIKDQFRMVIYNEDNTVIHYETSGTLTNK